MINKKVNESIKKQLNKIFDNGESMSFSFSVLVLMCFCILLIIISTFTQLDFSHPIIPFDIFTHWDKYFTAEGTNWHGFIKHYKYIPQIPMIFFILALLDKKYASMTVGLYILLGLAGFPIFALGGGFKYIFEYGFGYIVGYIPAILFAGYITRNNRSFLNVLKCVCVGVLVIHLIGSLGMTFIATLRHNPSVEIFGWLITMSGMKIFYDIIFSLSFYYIGYAFKKFILLLSD